MGAHGEPIADEGRPLAPLDVVRAMRWLGDLDAREIVDAIRQAADVDLAVQWPELAADEIAEMRRLCSAMTASRLRAWNGRRERQPTWLEVRALITGLREILL